MAKKRQKPPRTAPPPESRLADVATVGWMLAVMTTLVCQLAAVVVWAGFRNRPEAERVLLFGRFLHFSAIVAGVVSLVGLVIVLKTRRGPVPTTILVAAVCLAAAPILAVFLFY